MDQYNDPTAIDGEFTDGDPLANPPVPRTVLRSVWPNMVQRELLNVLTAAGIEPDAEAFDQVATAIDQIAESKVTPRGLGEYAVYFPVAEINNIVDQGVYVTSGTLAQIGVDVPGDWGSIAGSIVMRVTRRQNLSPGDIVMQEITFQALNALGGIRYARTKYIGTGPGTLWSPFFESSEQIAAANGFIDELTAEGFSQRIPGGLVMKFGKFTRTGPSPVDFIDGAFPSIVFGVHLQVISPGGSWWLEPRNVTTSGFEFAATPGPNTPPNWTDGTYIAFGF